MSMYNHITSEKYFRISHSLEWAEIQPQLASSNMDTFIFVQEVRISWAGRPKYYQSGIVEYSIFDSSWLTINEIKMNEWKLVKVDSFGDNAPFYLVDPKCRVSSKSWGKGIEGIINAIKLLKDYTRFPSIEYMTLIEENEALKAENSLLLEEQIQLRGKLNP